MKTFLLPVLVMLSIVCLQLLSCSKEDAVQNDYGAGYTTTPYTLKVPPGFPPPVIPDANAMTVEGVTLGRKLYYDPILSTNGLSCSSCHPQQKAFTSGIFSGGGEPLSIKPHINVAFNTNLLWDGSMTSPESVCMVDFGPQFFNTDMKQLVKKLKAHRDYPAMFYKAFNVADVGAVSAHELQVLIVKAVSQFIRTLISADSKFDKIVRHEASFTSSEANGYLIFMTEKGDCFHCHGTMLFTNNTFNNTGLDCNPTGQNLGKYLTTGKESDKGKFLAPTLRNIALTAPYMHDGRFETLEEVIEFYNSGVCSSSPNIDPLMTLPAKEFGLQLGSQEKIDLINFLKTLTDSSFITNPEFSKPN